MLPERRGYAGRWGCLRRRTPWLSRLSIVRSDIFCDYGRYQSPAFKRPCLNEFSPGLSLAEKPKVLQVIELATQSASGGVTVLILPRNVWWSAIASAYGVRRGHRRAPRLHGRLGLLHFSKQPVLRRTAVWLFLKSGSKLPHSKGTETAQARCSLKIRNRLRARKPPGLLPCAVAVGKLSPTPTAHAPRFQTKIIANETMIVLSCRRLAICVLYPAGE